MRIDPEAFDDWRHGPITEAMFRAMEKWAQDAKTAWLTASWEGGKCDPVLLADLRARATVLEQLLSVTGMQIEEAINDQDG